MKEELANKFFQMWKESPGHYKNFMHKDYKTMWFEARLGKAKALDQDSDYKYEFLAGTQILSLKDEDNFKRDEGITDMNTDKVDGAVAIGEDNATEKSADNGLTEEKTEVGIGESDAKETATDTAKTEDSDVEEELVAEGNTATEDSESSKETLSDISTNTESANTQSDDNADMSSSENSNVG